MASLLSTRQLASLFSVTQTTIKRWADLGHLPCVKTVGGHRKFVVKDILRFAEDHRYPLTGSLAPPKTRTRRTTLEASLRIADFSTVADIVLEEALEGNTKELHQLLLYLTTHHVEFATIADEVIRPAMAAIGRLWREGKLEINREHLASQAVMESIIRLSPELHRKPSNGKTAVCACAEGELHEIGLRAVSYALDTEGWEVQYLGAATPFDALASYITVSRPEAVCLSCTAGRQSRSPVNNIRSIGKLVRSYKGIFIVGGLFAAGRTSEEFSCDSVAGSARDAIALLKERLQLRPGPKKRNFAVA